MGVFTSNNMIALGNVVDISAIEQLPGLVFLQPGDSLDMPFAVRKGLIKVAVMSIDKDRPTTAASFIDTNQLTTLVGEISTGMSLLADDPGGGPGTSGGSLNCLPITVDLIKIGEAIPVATVVTKAGLFPLPTPDNPTADTQTHLEAFAGSVDETAPYVRHKWAVRFTNTTDRVARVGCSIGFIRDTSLITGAFVPLPVLRNALSIVLHALAPRARLNGGSLTLGISPEIAEFMDSLPEDGEKTITLPNSITATGELMSLGVDVISGADTLQAVDEQSAKLLAALPQGTNVLIQAHRQAIRSWKDGWHANIAPGDVVVKIDIVLSDIDVALRALWTEIELAEIRDASAKIYFVFKSHTAFTEGQFGSGHALVISPVHVEGALARIADLFGQLPDIAEKIEGFANEVLPIIHRYFAEAMVRLVGNQFKKRFIDFKIEGENLIVRYCDDPADPGAFPRPAPVSATPPGPAPAGGQFAKLFKNLGGTFSTQGAGVEAGEAPPPPPLGVVPSGFDLGSERSLARLDEVETIIVLMMENRSFDHMLGRLSRNRPGRGYICYPDEASNSVPDHSPLKMVHARNIEIGDTFLALRVDPYHNTRHVLDQINGGKMDGFARDIMTKPDLNERVPQLPLTFYEEADIPIYYKFADNHLVCDRWFAAHPGGTYPNRWALLSGRLFDTRNFEFDDPMMGFVGLPTIFDHLTNTDPPVEWAYYESNFGMIRMYDRYRLDNRRVLPIEEPDVGFFARAAAGTLPPVVFIEPGITGIPPLAQASDDHPPANIVRGQELLGKIYDALRASPQWPKAMMVVTYDEHGGFYDHMPPPGTPFGDPDFAQDGFPKLHPDGATFLGPRVPTFIVSPLVEPGTVSHAIFDHTSIIKTILVRHRAKIRQNIFGLFGERVAMINHLGIALNRKLPVSTLAAAPVPAAEVRAPARTLDNFGDRPTPRNIIANLPPAALVDRDEVPYGFSLARLGMPKR